MTEDRENPNPEDPIVLVYLRNEFYKNKFHWVFGVCCLGLIVILALTSMLLYITRNPIHPLYFVADKAGRLIQDIPITQPNMKPEDVEAWATQAVLAANTYDFANYHAQLQLAQKYFTDFGWRSYMKGLQASNNLVALTQRKLIFTARAIGPAKIINQGHVGKLGTYAWQVKVPVVVTYLLPPYDGVEDKSRFDNSYIFTVLIMRQSLLSSYKGLGISQIIGTSTAASGGGESLLPSPPS